VYLLSHLRGKKHQQAIADNHTGRELTRQEIVSWSEKSCCVWLVGLLTVLSVVKS